MAEQSSPVGSDRPVADTARRKLLVGLHDTLLDIDAGAEVSALLRKALLGETGGKANLFTDLGAAQAFALRVLPAFYVTSGLCYLSGHASLGPDYNGPEGARLREEWPIEPCDRGWHEDLNAADGEVATIEHQCAAILRCVMKAVAFREGITEIPE